jgi:hypothetical protein
MSLRRIAGIHNGPTDLFGSFARRALLARLARRRHRLIAASSGDTDHSAGVERMLRAAGVRLDR